MSDLTDILAYIYENERDSFEQQLCDRELAPYDLTSGDFDALIDEYTADPSVEKLDWLAEHSQGHVYCCAVRLSRGR